MLALVAAAAFLFPYILMMVLIVAYLCHIPFSVRSQRWVAAHPEVWDDKPKQRRAARRAIRRAQPQPPVDGAARACARPPAGHDGASSAARGVGGPLTRAPQLALTARLNTSAVDARRGVVRLHPERLAALGIREWDAVSLTGSRTTAGGGRPGRPQTPVGTVLLDDVTLSNAGLSEDTAVIVAAVTVYGARSVTLSGSALASHRSPPTTLRQALLGKVLTVGDAVSLLPRDLGPGTSTSAATQALASPVGISWTSELLTVTGVDPDRTGERATEFAGDAGAPASRPTTPRRQVEHRAEQAAARRRTDHRSTT